MITCLSWIRKGTAKEIPLITDLSDEEEGREEKEKKEEEEKEGEEGEERENSDDEERLFHHSPIVLTPPIVPFLFLFHIPTIFSNLTYFPVFV